MPYLGSQGSFVGKAKDIQVKPISSRSANVIIKDLHYSGKVAANSQLHLGVFLDGKCGGALQFGPSLDKRKMLGLVKGTKWNEFLELNRMALADWLPRNGESRVISVALRLIKKTYPWIKWVISFADATQCGDGTIYRACGFVLTNIGKNTTIGYSERLKQVVAKHGKEVRKQGKVQLLKGFQIRYIYFLHPKERENLTVEELPYSAIQSKGAGMYRGERRVGSIENDAPGNQSGQGGGIPTPALQSSKDLLE